MATRVPDRRRLLIAIALLLAVGEYVDAFFISFPAGAAGFATLLLLAVVWIRRGGLGGPIAAAALFTFEDWGSFLPERVSPLSVAARATW